MMAIFPKLLAAAAAVLAASAGATALPHEDPAPTTHQHRIVCRPRPMAPLARIEIHRLRNHIRNSRHLTPAARAQLRQKLRRLHRQHGLTGGRSQIGAGRFHCELVATSSHTAAPASPHATRPHRLTEPGATGAFAADPTNDGWALLGEGRGSAGLRIFAARRAVDPDDGDALLGYAVAAAMLGRFEQAADGLHRTLLAAPEAVIEARPPGALAERLAKLQAYLERRTPPERRSADEHVLLAVVARLAGDVETARTTVHAAVAAGDRRPATLALQRVLSGETG